MQRAISLDDKTDSASGMEERFNRTATVLTGTFAV